MPTTIAINVAANTTLPGFRGPIYPDGRFQYVPIPEREPAEPDVPTYAELGIPDDLPFDVPEDVRTRQVHFDPEFADYYGHDRYTYGDEHGVKAGPLSTLDPGDSLLFYATLTTFDPEDGEWLGESGERVDWRPPEWGTYVIGEFVVREVLTGEAYREADPEERAWAATNAHVRRETFDAAVLVRGSDESRLYDRAVPLSTPDGGATANHLVTDLSNDSGKGPWWRRVLRYDATATETLRSRLDTDPSVWLDGA
ncbi:MAG: hypothetical protein ABEI99_08250 [Halobaculum sp.]